MSDYGFKTLDKSNATSINAKHPIFGFDMGHLPRAFKTLHFTITKENPLQTSDVQMPDPVQIQQWFMREAGKSGVITEQVAKIKHGYNFRPLGYVMFSGKVKISKKYSIQQTEIDTQNAFGGDYTTSSEKPENQGNPIFLVPNSGETFLNFTGYPSPQYPIVSLKQADFIGSVWPFQYQPQGYMTNNPYGQASTAPGEEEPRILWAAIDDEYVYIYMSWGWSDTIRRAFIYSGSTKTYDLVERVKVATQYTGSAIDATIYLCPYPMEELLNKADTHINPSQVGIWDVDYWDGGKVYGQ